MFCRRCGKELQAGAKFCSGCGLSIVADKDDSADIDSDKQLPSSERSDLNGATDKSGTGYTKKLENEAVWKKKTICLSFSFWQCS